MDTEREAESKAGLQTESWSVHTHTHTHACSHTCAHPHSGEPGGPEAKINEQRLRDAQAHSAHNKHNLLGKLCVSTRPPHACRDYHQVLAHITHTRTRARTHTQAHLCTRAESSEGRLWRLSGRAVHGN